MKRHLQIEDEFECHVMSVAVFEESDVPQFHKTGEEPAPRNPPTWAWGFTDEKTGEIEVIWLGFTSKDAAVQDAWDYRRSMLEDYTGTEDCD